MFHWLKRLIRRDPRTQPSGCGEVVRSGDQLDRDVLHPSRETNIGDTESAVVLQCRWTSTERRAPVGANTKSTHQDALLSDSSGGRGTGSNDTTNSPSAQLSHVRRWTRNPEKSDIRRHERADAKAGVADQVWIRDFAQCDVRPEWLFGGAGRSHACDPIRILRAACATMSRPCWARVRWRRAARITRFISAPQCVGRLQGR